MITNWCIQHAILSRTDVYHVHITHLLNNNNARVIFVLAHVSCVSGRNVVRIVYLCVFRICACVSACAFLRLRVCVPACLRVC
jgi:hypothetical protein